MSEENQGQKHAAALAGFREAEKEITWAQNKLEAAQQRIEAVGQAVKTVVNELVFIQRQYPGFTFTVDPGSSDLTPCAAIELSTKEPTKESVGITGLKITANAVYVYDSNEGTSTYKNTKEDLDAVIQSIAKKAAIDGALANAEKTPPKNGIALTLAKFL